MFTADVIKLLILNLNVDIKVIQICQTWHPGRKPCSNKCP